jgi:hypothetical protein
LRACFGPVFCGQIQRSDKIGPGQYRKALRTSPMCEISAVSAQMPHLFTWTQRQKKLKEEKLRKGMHF